MKVRARSRFVARRAARQESEQGTSADAQRADLAWGALVARRRCSFGAAEQLGYGAAVRAEFSGNLSDGR
jgi:hypothetical protein